MRPTCRLHALPYRPDPTGYFERLLSAPGAVLLDSGRPSAQRGRYDIMSAWPVKTIRPETEESGPSFFQRARRCLGELGDAGFPDGTELPFAGGLLGYLAYDFGRRLDAPLEREPDDIALPDAILGLYDWALISDHHAKTSQLIFHPRCTSETQARVLSIFPEPQSVAGAAGSRPRAGGRHDVLAPAFTLHDTFRPSTKPGTYRLAIERILDYIRAGDCYQVNYTQRFQAPYEGDPWPAYLALRHACPTPFAGYLALDENATDRATRAEARAAILSLSPERFMRLQERQIEARPIKGTRPRGQTEASDRQQAEALRNSIKDRAENVMIVDLLRNDIGRSSRIGSVHVPELFSLETYPNVHHLVSCVRAELAEGLDAFDLLAGSFPGGSITGAPKIRAMQIIDELEANRRSIYCGSLLYVDVRGEMDSSITIRTLLAKDGRISCWGGGGIVMDSNWQDEYQESLDKVTVLLRTLESRFIQRRPD